MERDRVAGINYEAYDGFDRDDLIEELEWCKGRLELTEDLLGLARRDRRAAVAKAKELEREVEGKPMRQIYEKGIERANQIEAIQMIIEGKWVLDKSTCIPRIVRSAALKAREHRALEGNDIDHI